MLQCDLAERGVGQVGEFDLHQFESPGAHRVEDRAVEVQGALAGEPRGDSPPPPWRPSAARKCWSRTSLLQSLPVAVLQAWTA